MTSSGFWVNPKASDYARTQGLGRQSLRRAEEASYVLRFVDADASVESGLILLGIDIELLVAGLYVADSDSTVADCFAAVDVCRHRGSWNGVTFEEMLLEGRQKYDQVAGLVDQVVPLSGSPRQAWVKCYSAVIQNLDPEPTGSALVFLAACLFRHHQASGVEVARKSDEFDQ